MKITKPITVTTLTSNVPQGNPGTYNAGTTYALGARVGVLSGTTVTVYESLQNSNTGNTPASSPSWWKLIGTTYLEWDSGTSYSEGDIVILASTKRKYESLVNGHTGNNPATSPANWLDIGPTNRWAMFDDVNGTATTVQDEIDVTVSATSRVDSVALLGLTAASVQIIAEYDSAEVYNETYNLTDRGNVSDWYEYFFSDITFASDLIVTDLPRYGAMDVRVIITGSGAVSCGTCVIGLARELGAAVYGVRVGIIDHSRKQADDFGNLIVVERPFSRRMEADVVIEGASSAEVASKVDGIQKLLAEFRATPVVWQASEAYGSTAVFGFFRSFDIEIAYPLRSNLTLSIEGLT